MSLNAVSIQAPRRLRGTLMSSAMSSSESKGELAALVRAVAAGDTRALASLYRVVEGRVYAFACSRLNDPEQAAEVLQDVMLEVWRGAAGFEGRSRALTWILGITHHKIGDTLRRRARWDPDPPPGEDIPDTATPAPTARAERNERKAQVRRALTALSDAHRQIIHLALYQGLSYPEISRLLGIPEGTVKTRMFHARKALKQHLAGRFEGGAS